MEALILVGGLGTRLGSLTKTTPKPMLAIRGEPFLERLLISLKKTGFDRVVLAVGYKKEIIESYFNKGGGDFPEIDYSIEESLLGTGGAIKLALPKIKSDNFFVLNGDSYLELDYSEMQEFHRVHNSSTTIASCYMDDASRYGVLEVNDESRVLSFEEKGKSMNGLINGGVYLINKQKLFSVLGEVQKTEFSFEEDVLSCKFDGFDVYHFQTGGFFLDIGIPEDYEKAQNELFL